MNTPTFFCKKKLLCVIGLQRFYLDPAAALPCALLVFRCADAPRKVRLHSVSLRMTHTAMIKDEQKTKKSPLQNARGRRIAVPPLFTDKTASTDTGICRARITGDTVTAYWQNAFGVQLARVFGKSLSPSYTNRRLSAQRNFAYYSWS